MFKPARKIYHWAAQKASSPLAPLWLGCVFLLELFLFIPLDALLMLFCLENPERRYLYVLVAVGASAMSALIGFAVGYLLWDTIGSFVVEKLLSEDTFNRFVEHYNHYEQWAVMLGSLLPVPFKLVSLSAGFCSLAFWPYLGCVLVARALRFSFVAEMMFRFGPPIKSFIDRHFNRIVFVIGAKIAFALTFLFAFT